MLLVARHALSGGFQIVRVDVKLFTRLFAGEQPLAPRLLGLREHFLDRPGEQPGAFGLAHSRQDLGDGRIVFRNAGRVERPEHDAPHLLWVQLGKILVEIDRDRHRRQRIGGVLLGEVVEAVGEFRVEQPVDRQRYLDLFVHLAIGADKLADHRFRGILDRRHVDQRQVGGAVEGGPVNQVERPPGLRVDRDLRCLGQRHRAEGKLGADVLEIEPLGHRFLQRGGELLVAKDEVGHLAAQLVGFRDLGETFLRRAPVILQFEQVLEHREAALGAGNPETVHEAKPVAPARERNLQPRYVFRDDLGDDAVPVERRTVVAHEDLEPAQRRRNRFEIACRRFVFRGHSDRSAEACRLSSARSPTRCACA